MKIREIMTPVVESVREHDTVLLAAQRMRERDVGALAVVNDEDQLTGMLTDRDIVVRAIAHGRDPSTERIREIMTPCAVACPEDQTIGQAAKIMEIEQIRRLPIVDASNRPIGIVSVGDLAGRGHDAQRAGEVLEGTGPSSG